MTYTCPMHPEVQQDKPGMCSECGMALVEQKEERKEKKRPDKHKGHSTNVFAKKFWVSLVLSIPIVLYSPILQVFLGWSPPIFAGSWLIPLILGSIVFFYGGWVFLRGGWMEVKGWRPFFAKASKGKPGMMTLISLAIITAYVYSVVQVLSGLEETLFWELTTLIVIMLLGHWMEMRAVQSTQGALKELSKLLPDTAEVEREGGTTTVPLNQLRVDDVVVVRPGSAVASDGEIIEGESEIDESLATGESKPVTKKVGDAVIAGTINGDGSLRVQVTKIGEDTFLAGVMRLVQEAQTSKSKLQLLSDRAAFYLTIIAVAAGLLTLFVWLPLRGADFGFTRMVAVLVIACPHALGLAIPLVATISTTMAARNGFLVRDRLALEAARAVDVVLFDKTGTLTEGEFQVTDVSSDKALALAAAVNAGSEHLIGKAIVAEAHRRSLKLPLVHGFKRVAGRGVEGEVQGRKIFVGHQGGDEIVVLSEGDKVGAILVADAVRPESLTAVAELQKLGVGTAMITGDAESVAKKVADELGIEDYYARVLPEDKVSKIKELQQQGKKVAMVGDGINDAPALTQADVGIAIGAGTNVAIESAGIVLIKNDPRDIPKIIQLSRLTYSKMIQNLFWATGYNVVALPLAAGVAVTWGIVLNPAVSAIFMSLSTVIVAVNAVLLRRQPLGDKEVMTA